jgi:hypothetical protein
MRNTPNIKRRKPTAGSRLIKSLHEAVDWAEGKSVPVRVTAVDLPGKLNRCAHKLASAS